MIFETFKQSSPLFVAGSCSDIVVVLGASGDGGVVVLNLVKDGGDWGGRDDPAKNQNKYKHKIVQNIY